MKILNLVLYSRSNDYDKMKVMTENYYKKFDFVKTIYYMYSDIKEQSLFSENILYFQGTESYNNITEKTLKAFKYNYDYNYDYIVRTNISTIFNFDVFTFNIKSVQIDYGCTAIFGYHCECCNSSFSYSSGTSIILSKKVINYINNNGELFNLNLIDDVSIGHFINKYMSDIKLIQIMSLIWVDNYTTYENNNVIMTLESENKFNKMLNDNTNVIAFRNHNLDRRIDVLQMDKIINHKNEWEIIGYEGDTFLTEEYCTIRYGFGEKYVIKYFHGNEKIQINNEYFEGDPCPNYLKYAQIKLSK